MNDRCCASKGMCIHEKMMLIAVIMMIPLAGHFAFHWF
jgi:hypothetical protein